MSLRLKIVLALILLSVCATGAIGVASYTATRHELEETVDSSLDAAARSLQERPSLGDPDDDGDVPTAGRPGHEDPPRSLEQVLYQVLDADGTVLTTGQMDSLPVFREQLVRWLELPMDEHQRLEINRLNAVLDQMKAAIERILSLAGNRR